jgi:hypothetical protein
LGSYSQRIDVDPKPGRWAGGRGEAVKDRLPFSGPKQPEAIDRSSNLHTVGLTERREERFGSRAAHRYLGSIRWKVHGLAPVPFRDRNQRRVAKGRGPEHFVIWLTGLEHDPSRLHRAAPVAATDQPGGLSHQRHGLFRCSLANREQLLVNVQKDDHIGLINSVQYRFGSDRYPSSWSLLGCRGDLVDRFTQERFEFFFGSIHSDPEQFERG